MPAAYPSALPLPTLGHTREQPAAFRLAEPRRGKGYVELIGTDVPVFWSLTWRMHEDKAQTLRRWFVLTLQRGSLPFAVTVRTEFGLVEHELQFMPEGLLPAKHLGGGIWEYTANVTAPALNEAFFNVWNPADKNVDVVLSNEDETASLTAPLSGMVRAVTWRGAGVNAYFEVTFSGSGAADGRSLVGVVSAAHALNTYPGSGADGWSYFGNTGEKYNNGAPAAYGATFGNVTVGVHLNANTLTFYNPTSQGVAFTGLSGVLYPAWGSTTATAGTRSATINTGQSAFVHGLPSGAEAWG